MGQIWVLQNNPNDVEKLISNIIKFSVDILIVNLKTKPNILSENLYIINLNLEHMRFQNFMAQIFLFKILIDKILSLIFLIVSSPVLITCGIFIILRTVFQYYLLKIELVGMAED